MAKILVVDDEVGIRELLSEILRDEGHDVQLAENAAAARAARNHARPDLVLLDIWMPDTDGITLLKEWSAAGQLSMPVVMMSGHGTIDTAVEATRIGAQDFLEKPIALQKLLAAVKRALQKSVAATRRSELTLAAFARSSPLRDLKKRLDQVAAKSRVLMLKTGPGSLAELVGRSLQAPGKAWLDLAGLGQPLALEMLEQAAGGLLFAGELSALSRLQQKNLAFALDRLDKFDLRLVAASAQTPSELAQAGFDEALARRLAEVSLGAPGLAELKDEVPELAALEPAILALWHGQHILAPAFYPSSRKLVAMVSKSADAELNAKVLERFGVATVRGSGGRAGANNSDKGGARALLQLKKALDGGSNVCMIADIPHGTPRDAGDGIILLARISGRPIIPAAIATSRRKVLDRSWDKTTINLPFGRGVLHFGRPIHVPADADAETMEALRRELTGELNATFEAAYRMVEGRA